MSGKFWGQIHWPTKLNSLTKVSGEIIDNKISLKETQLIAGELDLFELPCSYEGVLKDKQISFHNNVFDVQISLIGPTCDIPFPFLTPGVTLDGICTEQLGFNFEITSQKGKKCEATSHYQSSIICPSETASSLLTEQHNLTIKESNSLEEIKIEVIDTGTQYSIRPTKSGMEILVNKGPF